MRRARYRCVFRSGLLSAALASSLAAAPFAYPADAAAHQGQASAGASSAQCFFRRDWDGGWKATPDARTIYIRVSGTVYRLDLQGSYSVLRDPFAILTNKDSADSICTPLDFRLMVSNQAGIEQWPIVKSMTRLTPEEAAALPKKLRP